MVIFLETLEGNRKVILRKKYEKILFGYSAETALMQPDAFFDEIELYILLLGNRVFAMSFFLLARKTR